MTKSSAHKKAPQAGALEIGPVTGIACLHTSFNTQWQNISKDYIRAYAQADIGAMAMSLKKLSEIRDKNQSLQNDSTLETVEAKQ